MDLATASDSGASNSDNLTNDSTPTLTGIAEAGSTVTVRDGATVLGTATADAGTGAWTFTTGVLADGAHSLTATATDAAGNTGSASAVLVVTVDAAASAPVVTGFADDTGGAGDRVTLDTTLVITGTAEAGATVQIFDGPLSLGTATANGAGAWSFATAVLDPRHHSFTAKQTDAAGNVSAVSAAHDVRVGYDIDTATMTANEGFRIYGADADDFAGWSVSSAGDINGDGFDDMIVGARGGDGAANGKSYAGEAIVVFGKATGFADVDAGAADFVSSGKGFRIFGADAEEYAGIAVSAAGDINGDGYGDLIVGVNGNGPANDRNNAGEAIVVFGKATGFGNIDVSTMTGADGFRIFAADTADHAGYSVSSAGDINGDGYDDLIVGALGGSGPANDRNTAGEAIVVFGKATGFADIDVATMTAAQGFRIYGADAGDFAGRSVSAAGDINGDGFDDLIVGARSGDVVADLEYTNGEAIVVFGKATGFADIDVSTMTGADGFRIYGADPYDYAGLSVSTAGDFNGDGFDDLIVGAMGGAGPANDRYRGGEAIVVFGKGPALPTSTSPPRISSRPARASASTAPMRTTMPATRSPRQATSMATASTTCLSGPDSATAPRSPGTTPGRRSWCSARRPALPMSMSRR